MRNAASVRIHPTAVVAPEVELADDVQVGPYAVLEGAIRLGAGCIVRPHAYLCGPLTMGKDNVVYSGAVLGERPQHFKYNDERTGVEVGDHNVFRENVTVHRGTMHSVTTKIGNHNFFMVGSHVAHDCRVGNHCIIANGAQIAGHCLLEDNVYLSGNCAIHQFVRVGRLALLSGCSATTKDIPPFVIQQGIDTVVGVNVIGMRRAGMTGTQIDAVRQAFRLVFRAGLTLPAALDQIETEWGKVDAVGEFVRFIRQSTHGRGINPMRERGRREAA